MDQLFKRVRVGTPVTIVGGRGQAAVLGLVRSHASADDDGDDTAID
jgi:hypothetical protein